MKDFKQTTKMKAEGSHYCGGGKIKKMAEGSLVGALRDKIMGTPAQNQAALASEAKYLKAKQLQKAAGQSMGPGEQMAMGLAGAGQSLQGAPAPAPAPGVPTQKAGGKVKRGTVSKRK